MTQCQVNPQLRIPRTYKRFSGLMVSPPPSEPLLTNFQTPCRCSCCTSSKCARSTDPMLCSRFSTHSSQHLNKLATSFPPSTHAPLLPVGSAQPRRISFAQRLPPHHDQCYRSHRRHQRLRSHHCKRRQTRLHCHRCVRCGCCTCATVVTCDVICVTQSRRSGARQGGRGIHGRRNQRERVPSEWRGSVQ